MRTCAASRLGGAADERYLLAVLPSHETTLSHMNTLKKLFSVALLFPTLACAQPVPSATELRKVTDQIMEQVGRGNLEAGFKLMKSRTIIPPAEFDAMVGQANLQIPVISQRFGGNLGYEFLREDKVGDNLVRYTYIQRFDRHAMRWLFYNYRGKDGWVINSFRFDDQLPSLFP